MAEAGPLDAIAFGLGSPPAYERRLETAPPAWPSVPVGHQGDRPQTERMSADRPALDDWLARARRARVETASLLPGGAVAEPVAGVITARLSAQLPLGGAVTEAVGELDAWPVSAVGRLTTGFGDRRRFCTAWVVSERIVATAAHCVFHEGLPQAEGFADWALFASQDRLGAVRGRWGGVTVMRCAGGSRPSMMDRAARLILLLSCWMRPLWRRRARLGLVQWRRIRGHSQALVFHARPTDGFQFDGRFLFASTGRLAAHGNGQMEAENGLTEGSSGGPWLSLVDGQLKVVG